MVFLKQSTSVTLMIGPFLDDGDGNTIEDGLTVSQADVRLSKNAGNMAQKAESTSCTHDELGYYTCPVDTDDTDTLGVLQLMVHESGALPVWHEYHVVPANVWDSLFSTDKLQVDVVQSGGSAVAAGAIPNVAAAANGGLPTVDANNRVVGVQGTINDFDGLENVSTAEVNTEVDNALNTAVPGSPVAHSINERVKAIDEKLPSGTISDFDETSNDVDLNADQSGVTVGTVNALGAQAKLDVNAEVDNALDTAVPGSPTAHSVNQRVKALDELTEASGSGDLAAVKTDTDKLFDGAMGTPAADSLADELMNKDGNKTYDSSTDSLEALRERGDAAWTTGSGGDATEAKQDTIIAEVNKLDSAATTVPASAVTGSLLDRIVNKDGSKTYSQATDSLEALRERGDAAWTGTGTGGADSDTQTLTIDDGSAPLSGVAVYVSNDDGATWPYYLDSDSNGECDFHLADGTWAVQCQNSTYAHTQEDISVSGSGSFTISMTAFSPSAPAGPSQCVVFGYLRDVLDATLLANETVTVQLARAPAGAISGAGASGTYYSCEPETVTSNASGYWEASLPYSSVVLDEEGNQVGTVIECLKAGISRTITVPDAASKRLDLCVDAT